MPPLLTSQIHSPGFVGRAVRTLALKARTARPTANVLMSVAPNVGLRYANPTYIYFSSHSNTEPFVENYKCAHP